MRRGLVFLLAICLTLTGCGVLPQHTDAADEAILRTVILSREEGGLKITAVTGGEQSGEEQQPPELDTGSGEDYFAARDDLKSQRQASLVHVTDWVVEEAVLGDALDAFVDDPELTYSAHIYLLREQSGSEFVESFGEELSVVRALEDLDRAVEGTGVTVLELSARLAKGQPGRVPVLKGEDGKVLVTEEVEISRWP